jgi:hypothetical protein
MNVSNFHPLKSHQSPGGTNMATARQAAIVRTVLALAAVTNNVHVRRFDPLICEIEVDDPLKLQGTFSDIGVQPMQLTPFRQLLASFCPEISADIMDPVKCPLNVDMQIKLVANFVDGNLVASPNFRGDCIRH